MKSDSTFPLVDAPPILLASFEPSAVVQAPGSSPVVAEPSPSPSLPQWVTPLLLGGLALVSGLIVLVGWLVVKPSQPHATIGASLCGVAVPSNIPALTTPPALSEKPPTAPDDSLCVDEEPPPALIQLQRRLPSRPDETEQPTLAMPIGVMAVDAPGSPIQGPRLIAPLIWTTEPPRSGEANLIMPIEIATIEDGSIPYNIRRLRFHDEAPTPLRLAVTPFSHDDLGSVLTKMGEGYRFTNIRNEDLLSLSTLKKYDVLFLTCADMYAQDFQAAGPLRRFVQQGGTLYASDLRGDLVLAAFPEFRARVALMPGVPQNIDATVYDKGMQSYLSKKAIPLSFEANDWRPAGFDATKVTVCLKGMYRNNLGLTKPAPLMVKFRVQKGTVVFTSFHHAKNDAEIVRKLLDYVVFATVNARSEARVKDLMARSQFAAHDLHPVLMTADKQVAGIFQHQLGALQVGVGFENLGARLKLKLRSPGGQTIEHEGQGLYQIEVPKAEPGAWQYTVTPVELPYSNFPVIVAIGGVKS